MLKTLLRVTFALGLTAGFVLAPAAQAQDSDRKVTYKKRTEIDFEALEVSGELVKPQGALLLDRKRANFNPLIKIRSDFNAEMNHSVDQIK